MTKSLIFSIIAIVLLFALSIVLSLLCMKAVDELQALTEDLPLALSDVDGKSLERIDTMWTSRRLFLSLILKKEMIVSTDISVKTLCAYGYADAQGDYHYARLALLENLNAISELEGISLLSIF